MIQLYAEDFTGEIYPARDAHGNPINEIGEVGGWTAFWYEDPAAIILRPEIAVIDAVAPYLDPPRTNGIRGVKVFKWHCRHDAGYWKQFTIPAGVAGLQITATGHHWYSQRDNPYLSEYKDADDVWHTITNGDPVALLKVGLDPHGGTDANADSVIWTQAGIYDHFADVTLDVDEFGALVTVFIRSTQQYAFLHADAYWSGVRIAATFATEPPTCTPANYIITVEVPPQNATLAEKQQTLAETHADKRTLSQSYDDTRFLVARGLPGSKVVLWGSPSRHPAAIEAWFNSGGVSLVEWRAFEDDEPEPPIDPPTGFIPQRFITHGLPVGFMGLGNSGLPELYNNAGLTAPTIKLQQAIWDIGLMPAQYRTVRLDDWPALGYEFSSFRYDLDPIWQAEKRMAQMLPLLEPLRGQFKYFEYCNEQTPPHDRPDLAAKIALFAMRVMDIAEASGWQVANLSFSTGEPTYAAFDVIAGTGFLEKCAAGGHAIALHAYLDHRVPSDITYHLCRYRYLWENHVLPRGLDIPLILTELGPWRHLLAMIDPLEFVVTVDNELRKDAYAMGQLYTVSDIGTEADYDRFWRDAYPRFIQYAVSVKDRANG